MQKPPPVTPRKCMRPQALGLKLSDVISAEIKPASRYLASKTLDNLGVKHYCFHSNKYLLKGTCGSGPADLNQGNMKQTFTTPGLAPKTRLGMVMGASCKPFSLQRGDRKSKSEFEHEDIDLQMVDFPKLLAKHRPEMAVSEQVVGIVKHIPLLRQRVAACGAEYICDWVEFCFSAYLASSCNKL